MKSQKIVIVGMGYVGFPLACLLGAIGHRVFGVDINQDKVDKINRGLIPFDYQEEGLLELFRKSKLKAGNNFDVCRKANAIIIAVETPVNERTNKPEYTALISALKSVGKNLSDGALVIVESTIAPGTTENVIVPTLESAGGKKAGRDFFAAHCPERVSPTAIVYKLKNMPRVIGGQTKKAGQMAAELYEGFVEADIDIVDAKTAEIIKTAGNAYRDVQIAFANELETICQNYGVNFWQVRQLINKEPERHVHRAGPGVGGHCIPKDSWLLLTGVDEKRGMLIRTARRINQNRPKEMFERLLNLLKAHRLSPAKAKIAILGVAYLPETDDARNSPTLEFIKLLKKQKLNFKLHDPFIKGCQSDLNKIINWADIAVIMTGHKVYRQISQQKLKHKIILDPRNIL